ncbi:thiol-disulfide oxidoreductase DCC family protein [Parvicella tangerina]|uniref:DUF393 domain-containing protein n=1 Tax=Parvicella tangerina TaxID=2829795 RepID=A0A916JPN7_9FLAO|nr:DUF393 domain-containing protein [Parvicella tangerina]CAG5085268.1 hypothetical protein CRYO30217_02706 [Parvicella tangerina]
MRIKQSDGSLLKNKRIIIFDGECAFCNSSVLFIRKHNATNNLLYCSSQTDAAKALISTFDIDLSPEDSLIYIKEGEPFVYSSAALEIAKELDHFWAMLSIFLIVPKSLRDRIYQFIAKYRKSIMGTSESCTIAHQELFQDNVLK